MFRPEYYPKQESSTKEKHILFAFYIVLYQLSILSKNTMKPLSKHTKKVILVSVAICIFPLTMIYLRRTRQS